MGLAGAQDTPRHPPPPPPGKASWMCACGMRGGHSHDSPLESGITASGDGEIHTSPPPPI